MQSSYVYIVTNKYRGTPYIGVTTNLAKRNYEHKMGVHPKSFTSKYNLDKFVYFEEHGCVEDAILREKKLKKFMREWKINLIEKNNPQWLDLTDVILGLSVKDPRASRCEPEDEVTAVITASSSRQSRAWGAVEITPTRDPQALLCKPEDDVIIKVEEKENA